MHNQLHLKASKNVLMFFNLKKIECEINEFTLDYYHLYTDTFMKK